MSALARVRTCWSRFLGDTRGNATLEFVVLFPWLLFMIFQIAELGVFMAQSAMLHRGVDMAMREVRLQPASTDVATVRNRICEEAFLLFNCAERLQIQVTPITSAADMQGLDPMECVDRSEETFTPADKFTAPGTEQLTFVRVCLAASPLFPATGLGAQLPRIYDSEGNEDYGIVAETAFFSEP